MKKVEEYEASTQYFNAFDTTSDSWRTIIVSPEGTSDSFSINQVGKVIWQDSTQDIRIIDRRTVLLDENSEVPPYVGLAQKVEHVEAGKPYTVSFHVKEFGPSAEQAIAFMILSKEAVDQYSFSAFDMESGMLSQSMYTDTGTYTFSFTSPTEQDVILYIGHVSVSEGYAVIDDVQLSTYAEQQLLAETFDDSIAPWRNSALTEAENPPLQAGTIEWEADSQRLKITQGDIVMDGDSIWLGAAARELPVQSYKQYRLSLDVLEHLTNSIDLSNIVDAVINIYDADEFALTGPLATQPILELDISQYGTKNTGTFRAKQSNIVALVAILSGKTQQPDAGVFYIDNLRLELVENSITYTCDANTPNTIIGGGYRYGFNGMERDDDVKGSGNSIDFGARIYDPRLGRWLSLDPLQAKYPFESNYSYTANNPIIYVDEEGKKKVVYTRFIDETTGKTIIRKEVFKGLIMQKHESQVSNDLLHLGVKGTHTEVEYDWYDINQVNTITLKKDGTVVISIGPETKGKLNTTTSTSNRTWANIKSLDFLIPEKEKDHAGGDVFTSSEGAGEDNQYAPGSKHVDKITNIDALLTLVGGINDGQGFDMSETTDALEKLVSVLDNTDKVIEAFSLDDDVEKINGTVIHDKADIDKTINWKDSSGQLVPTHEKATDTVNTSGKDSYSTLSTYRNALNRKK